jgi:hypothetical protein
MSSLHTGKVIAILVCEQRAMDMKVKRSDVEKIKYSGSFVGQLWCSHFVLLSQWRNLCVLLMQ